MDWTDLDAYQDLPRLSGLALSHDGRRLVATVSGLDAKKQRFVSALWEIDPEGQQPARRLTRSAKGEGSPVFTEDGQVLFTSGRPDPTADDDEDRVQLWALPPSGEAHVVGSRPGGVSGARVSGRRVVVSSDTLPSSTDGDDDAARRKARKDKKVSAVLHSSYPVRYWDADLGPGAPRLLTVELGEPWTDLTPSPGRALDEASYDVVGDTVVTTWEVREPRGASRTTLRLLDATTGEATVLADDPAYDFGAPRLSPDGTRVATIRWERSTPERAPRVALVVLEIAGGQTVLEGWDRWPATVNWTADGALLVTADEDGSCPVFRVEGQVVTRLSTDRGCYSELCPSPDGRWVYAVRSGYDAPPHPVRLDARTPGGPTRLPSPADGLDLPGRLEEVRTTVADGREVRSWLALPSGDGPHPLVLWVHGGPLMSWSAWSWRWCPWLLVAQGYAVLMPDPALSTGYGQEHVQVGWGKWGGPPYDDVMAATDAALARPDLDADRTAMMGASYGGYMANWIAGHTDRFRAIVSHASLWDLDRFGGTTDDASYWEREMTPEMRAANNPSAFADRIVTPMLVVHGDKDYRVPIGEGLSLWWDLQARADGPSDHRFLYFPDENHWVLTPGHATLWYETVLGFLGQHVRGDDEHVPELLK